MSDSWDKGELQEVSLRTSQAAQCWVSGTNSVFHSSQGASFLGMQIDSRVLKSLPMEERVDKLLLLLGEF